MNTVTEVTPAPRSAPVAATWICLGLAWLLFVVPVPGAGLFVGWPLNLVAFILAIVVMSRGRTAAGLVPLIMSLVISPVVYFIGLAIFAVALSSGAAYGDVGELFMGVQANGLPEHVAAALHKGQQITAACTGASLMVGSPVPEDCELR